MMASDHLSDDQFSYRGGHQPTFEGSVGAHEMDQMYPDYYEHPEYYHSWLPKNHPGWGPAERQAAVEHNVAHRQVLDTARRVRGNPNADVDIFRSAPHGVTHINTGDWVTTSEQYARGHGMQADEANAWPVLHARVKAHHVRAPGDYAPEFGYSGPSVKGQLR